MAQELAAHRHGRQITVTKWMTNRSFVIRTGASRPFLRRRLIPHLVNKVKQEGNFTVPI